MNSTCDTKTTLYRRRLPAEVMLDAVSDVTGLPDEFQARRRAPAPADRATKSRPTLDTFGWLNASSDCRANATSTRAWSSRCT
jgi:hypothetical protein